MSWFAQNLPRNGLIQRVRRHANLPTLFRSMASEARRVGTTPALLTVGQFWPIALPSAEPAAADWRTASDSAPVGVAADLSAAGQTTPVTPAPTVPVPPTVLGQSAPAPDLTAELQPPVVEPAGHAATLPPPAVQTARLAPRVTTALGGGTLRPAPGGASAAVSSVNAAPVSGAAAATAAASSILQPHSTRSVVQASPVTVQNVAAAVPSRSAQSGSTPGVQRQPGDEPHLGPASLPAVTTTAVASTPAPGLVVPKPAPSALPPVAPAPAPSAEDRTWARLQAIYRGHKEREGRAGPTATPVTQPEALSPGVGDELPVPPTAAALPPSQPRVQQPRPAVGTPSAPPQSVQRQAAVMSPPTSSATPVERSVLASANQPSSEVAQVRAPATEVNPVERPGDPATAAASIRNEITSTATAAADDDSDAEPSLPLEAVWPVQRTSQPADMTIDNAMPTDAAGIVTAAQRAALNSEIQQQLAQVKTGQPTESMVEMVLPRRPRPRLAVNTQHDVARPTIQRQDAASAPQAAVPSTGQPETMIQTAVGPLPADLWQLIGETPPASAPVPTLLSEQVNPAPAALARSSDDRAVPGTGDLDSIQTAALESVVDQAEPLTPVTQPLQRQPMADVGAQSQFVVAPPLAQPDFGVAPAHSAPNVGEDTDIVAVSQPDAVEDETYSRASLSSRHPEIAAVIDDATATASDGGHAVATAGAERVDSDVTPTMEKASSLPVVQPMPAAPKPRSSNGRRATSKSIAVESTVALSATAGVVQRQAVEPPAATAPIAENPVNLPAQSEASAAPAPAALDTEELARQVYAQLKRKLTVERERLRPPLQRV